MFFAALAQDQAANEAAATPAAYPTEASRPLAERFAAPGAAGRILPIVHTFPTDPAKQDETLQGLWDRGFGGMATNIPFTPYIGEKTDWPAFVRQIEQAQARGMALWLYDERGYPSGTAGNLTLQGHPEWEARGLLISQAETSGGAVSLPIPPGQLLRAAAYPVAGGELQCDGAVDLAGSVADGAIAWEAPAGAWRVMVLSESRLYEGTHAAISLAYKEPYINLLMPEPTARFLEVNHDAYAAHLGNDLGKYFTATFTDEPSLMSLFMRPQPWALLPWAPNLPVAFQERRGYPLDSVLPLLVAGEGPKTAQARYDFWQTVGELTSENFFGQIQQWCRAHNTQSGGHLLCEESFMVHVPLYGHFFQCLRRLDAPSMDNLNSIPAETSWQVAKIVSSAADLEGRADTMSESSDHCQRYRPQGDTRPIVNVTAPQILGSCNRLMANGINTFTSYYSFADLTPEQVTRINEYIARCCTLLHGGRQATSIALVYPTESLWPRFVPSSDSVKSLPQSAWRIGTLFSAAENTLFNANRDFTIVDARTLAEAEVRDGMLQYNGMAWRAVILPGVDTLPLAAWEHLDALQQAGGTVIALGALPQNSATAFPDPAVQTLAAKWFAAPAGDTGPVFLRQNQESEMLPILDKRIPRDIHIPEGAPLHTARRHQDDADVLFLYNDSADPWSGAIALDTQAPCEQWNPSTGQSTPVPDPATIPLQLEPYTAILFRIAK